MKTADRLVKSMVSHHVAAVKLIAKVTELDLVLPIPSWPLGEQQGPNQKQNHDGQETTRNCSRIIASKSPHAPDIVHSLNTKAIRVFLELVEKEL